MKIFLLMIATMIGCSCEIHAGNSTELRRLHDHCQVTSAAFDMDARDLSSGDPKRQVEAADRMIGTAVHHSWDDVVLCAQTPPVTSSVDQCWITKDFDCLAKIAREASASTKPKD